MPLELCTWLNICFLTGLILKRLTSIKAVLSLFGVDLFRRKTAWYDRMMDQQPAVLRISGKIPSRLYPFQRMFDAEGRTQFKVPDCVQPTTRVQSTSAGYKCTNPDRTWKQCTAACPQQRTRQGRIGPIRSFPCNTSLYFVFIHVLVIMQHCEQSNASLTWYSKR